METALSAIALEFAKAGVGVMGWPVAAIIAWLLYKEREQRITDFRHMQQEYRDIVVDNTVTLRETVKTLDRITDRVIRDGTGSGGG